ncbi:MAG: porin [Deinococcales bacterium]|nr:porin [Chitinophagaceae bacterium]
MFKKTLLSAFAMTTIVAASAQDSTKKAIAISGSVDAYYRFDFAGKGNNKTSFTNSNNSFELGMATLKLDHSIGKVSATADLGFGRRSQEFSYNDGAGLTFIGGAAGNQVSTLAAVKQLYITYAPNDKIKFTLGKFATHIGYELVDAVANRNYSMSYGFSYGPFFHTGLKADVSLGGKTAFMVGVANPTDFSTNTSPYQYLIAQLSTATKNDKLKVYVNYQGTSSPGFKLSQFDLVVLGVISDKFAINYDGTVQSRKFGSASAESWSSNALYFNYDPSSKFGLTLRGEYLSDKTDLLGIGGNNIFIPTLSANFKINNLTIIPEFRLDNAKNNIFIKSDGAGTKSASQFILAATYKF